MLFSNELLTEFIGFVDIKDLYACSLINRQFHAVANPYLWQSIHIKNNRQFTRMITGLRTTKPPMSHFTRNVHVNTIVTDQELLALLKHLPRLEHLVLKDATVISDTSLDRLRRYCPYLTSLSLHRASRRRIDIASSLRVLGRHCPHLSVLRLEQCYDFPATTVFDTLVTSCPNLRLLHLDLSHTTDWHRPHFSLFVGTGENDPVIASAPSSAHSAACQCVYNLVQLKHLTSMSFHGAPPLFSKHLLMSKTTSARDILLPLRPPVWPKLVSFSLGKCTGLRDAHVMDFITAHRRLRSLTLDTANFSDTTLHTIRTYLPHLTSLGLPSNPRLTATGLRRLVCACPHLTYVNVRQSGIVMAAFPEASATGGTSAHLRHLNQQAITDIQLAGLGDGDTGGDDDDAYRGYRDDREPSLDDNNDNGQSFSQRRSQWKGFYIGCATGRMNRMERLRNRDDDELEPGNRQERRQRQRQREQQRRQQEREQQQQQERQQRQKTRTMKNT